jgi:hypothetical protein
VKRRGASLTLGTCSFKKESLGNDYLDNLDTKSLNKYEKKIRNRKKFINMFFYL